MKTFIIGHSSTRLLLRPGFQILRIMAFLCTTMLILESHPLDWFAQTVHHPPGVLLDRFGVTKQHGEPTSVAKIGYRPDSRNHDITSYNSGSG